jgi:hypothetical protein
MTSREIVNRCIAFGDPPRIAMHFRTDPLDGRVWDETDFAAVSYAADPRFKRQPGQQEWITEWGVGRRSLDAGMGEAVRFPLGESWEALDTYRFPDLDAPWRFEGLGEKVARLHAEGKYVYAPVPSLMLLPIALRGMENWFVDHAEEQEHLAALLDRITDLRERLIVRYAEAGVDGVITYDDMGTNDRTLVSPAAFRELYFPRYKRTCDLLHERGMHFIHHCCGQVRRYMDMFVEAGCDVLQLDQPELMGIEWLGEHYGGRICFWNCVDIQKTIGSGDLDAIDDEAHRQVWALGSYGGGFMVKAYQQPAAVGMTVAQAERQYRAFKRLSAYPLMRRS